MLVIKLRNVQNGKRKVFKRERENRNKAFVPKRFASIGHRTPDTVIARLLFYSNFFQSIPCIVPVERLDLWMCRGIRRPVMHDIMHIR